MSNVAETHRTKSAPRRIMLVALAKDLTVLISRARTRADWRRVDGVKDEIARVERGEL